MRLFTVALCLNLALFISAISGCKKDSGVEKGSEIKVSETGAKSIEAVMPYDIEAEKAGESSRVKSARTKALVNFAISYMEKNGREKTFDAITNKNNPDHKKFIDGEFYIWVFQTDFESKAFVTAHAFNYTLINKEWYNTKDPDGKLFIQDLVRIAKHKGEGWVLYKWAHPVHKKASMKAVYLKRYEDLVFMNGFYL